MGVCGSKTDPVAPAATGGGEGGNLETKGFKANWTTSSSDDIWKHYKKGQKLGSGMTGAVYKITHQITGQTYACKSVKKLRMNPNLQQDLRHEIALLSTLDHPNIIKLYETYEDQSTIYMVLELATGGELYDHLIDADHYSEKEAAEYFYHMCQSINYCHNHDICHRDLKLENFIFENVSENAQLKLIDFGLSRKYSKNAGPKRMASIVGTAYYMAPEVLKRGGYTNKCDMWGLGAILYMMLSGRPPFDGESDRQIMEAVRLGKYEFGLEWSRVSPDAKNLVRRLLEMDPKKRISAEQCLAHPWLTKRAQMSKSPLSANVVESLKTFGKMNKLKQTAIDVIAFSLTQNQMKHLREAFKSMDKDNSGVIGIEEFHHALSDSGTSKAEIDELFTAIDRDGGGTISYSEFVAATVSRQNYLTEERLRAAFDRLDVDKTGDISLTDLKAVMGDMYNEDALKAMIGQADIHDDGKIHYEEFLEIMHRMNDA